MSIIQQNVQAIKPSPDSPKAEICALGHPLTDCPARCVGCRNHLEMLKFMMPPWPVRIYLRETMGNDSAVRQWLARLDAVLPGQQAPGKEWR